MNSGLTAVRARGSSVRNGLLTGEANQSRSPPWSLWKSCPLWRCVESLKKPKPFCQKPEEGAGWAGMAPLLKFSLPTAGGGGTTPPDGGATVSGAWARTVGRAPLLAIGSYDAGVTSGTAGRGSGSTTARGRPSVTAGRVLAITWRARTTAGGALVGLQAPSSP